MLPCDIRVHVPKGISIGRRYTLGREHNETYKQTADHAIPSVAAGLIRALCMRCGLKARLMLFLSVSTGDVCELHP